MLLHRGLNQRAVVAIDGLRTREARILEVGDLCQNIAPVMIESDHQLVVVCGQSIEQNTARVEVVDIGVPNREQWRDRLDGRMSGAGQKQRGGTEIRDSGRTDRAIGPWLRDDPIRDFAEVLAFGRRPEAVARPEARAGAAHIDDDERVAARHEEIAILRGIRRILGAGRRAGLQREAPVRGGQNEDRRQLRGRCWSSGLLREVDINCDAAMIAHRKVEGERLRRAGKFRWPSGEIFTRWYAPSLPVRIGIRHRPVFPLLF